MGFYGCGNTGDEALLASVLTNLTDTDVGNDKELIVFSSNPLKTERIHEVSSHNNYIPTGRIDSLTKSIGRGRKEYRAVLNSAKSLGALIIGGGGLFFDRPNDNNDLIKFISKINFFLSHRIPVYMIGISTQKLHCESSVAAMAKMLDNKYLRLVISRDPKSNDIFSSLSPKRAIFFDTEDIVFSLISSPNQYTKKTFEKKYFSAIKPNIALSLCGHSLKSNEKYKVTIGKAIDGMLKAGYQVIIIPMSTGKDNDLSEFVDQFEHEEFFNHIKIVTDDLSVNDIIQLYSQVDCVIAERLHANILALKSSVPVVGISYASKVSSLFHNIDRADWFRDINELNVDWLLNRVDLSVQNKAQIIFEIVDIVRTRAEISNTTFSIFNSRFLADKAGIS